MKKVLQVLPCLELGGTEAFIMNNYRHINRDDIQFDFMLFDKKDYPYLKEIKELGGNVYYNVQPSYKNFFKFYKEMKTILKTSDEYIAVHCHANSSNFMPLMCAKLCGIKKRIAHSHDTNQVPKTFVRKVIFMIKRFLIWLFATQYLACGKEAGRELYGNNFFSKKGIVIKNGINVEKFLNKDTTDVELLRKEFNINDSHKMVIGNISRFEPKKNQLFLVDVFSQILKINHEAILILGGVDGGQLEETKRRTKELGIDKSVRFIGRRNDVPQCLKIIDAYVMPSLYEGLPIGLLEAQATGCECFISDGVSPDSNMAIGTAHYYSLEDGSKSWAEKILKTMEEKRNITDDEILSAFRNKGYDILDSLDKLVKIYEKQ